MHYENLKLNFKFSVNTHAHTFHCFCVSEAIASEMMLTRAPRPLKALFTFEEEAKTYSSSAELIAIWLQYVVLLDVDIAPSRNKTEWEQLVPACCALFQILVWWVQKRVLSSPVVEIIC